MSNEKHWSVKPEDMRELLHRDGPEGCFATDRIMVDGCKVGYMYREAPDEGRPDSGWRFTAGDESEAYMNDPNNASIYTLGIVANNDPEIIPLLDSPIGSAFYRDADGVVQPDEMNLDARAAIDVMLAEEFHIERGEDFRRLGTAERNALRDALKRVREEYGTSADEVDVILYSMLGGAYEIGFALS